MVEPLNAKQHNFRRATQYTDTQFVQNRLMSCGGRLLGIHEDVTCKIRQLHFLFFGKKYKKNSFLTKMLHFQIKSIIVLF